MSQKSERVKNRVSVIAVLLATLLFGATLGYFALGVAPPFGNNVIQPGTMIQGFGYTVFGDAGNVYARNGRTGAIDYSGTSFPSVLQSAISAQTTTGSVYIKKLPFSQQHQSRAPDPTNPSNDEYLFDYYMNSTVYMHEGFIIDSDGAAVNVQNLNATAIYINGAWAGFYGLYNTRISNLNFLGKTANTNTTAVFEYRAQFGPVLDNIHTTAVSYPVVVSGANYRGLVHNAFFNWGKIGIQLFTGGDPGGGPNEFRIQDTDISQFTIMGIDHESGTAVYIDNVYMESNVLSIYTHGAEITNSFFQPGANHVAIKVANSNTFIVDSQFLLNTNSVGINATNSYSSISVQGNAWYIDTGATGILSSNSGPVFGSIIGNQVFVVTGSTTNHFIKGLSFQSMTISSNLITGGNAAIILNGSYNTVIGNTFYSGNMSIQYNGYYNTFTGNTFQGSIMTCVQQAGGTNNYFTGNIFGCTYKITVAAGGAVTASNNYGYP